METLKNKNYPKYSYLSRYTTVPTYFDTKAKRELSGIGTPMSKSNSYILHQVLPTDTLDSLALKYYNNPTFWWIIAYFNNILDPLKKLSSYFDTIKIPSKAGIKFYNERH